jgi:hypothetical protein
VTARACPEARETRPPAELGPESLRDRAVLFVHVPKTAGATLARVIRRQYTAASTWRIDDADIAASLGAFRRLPPAARAGIRCVLGHMPLGIHEELPGPAVYITLLRHPVTRLVSHYRHVRAHPEHPLHAAAMARGMDLERYAGSDLSPELDNGITRLLSGADPRDRAPLPGAALDRARANLRDHFAAVGLTERFDESLLLFRRLLGWGRVCYVRENTGAPSPGDPAVPAPARRAIERRNGADLELYELAVGLFRERLRGHGPTLAELADFRRRNRVHQALWTPVRRLGRRVKRALRSRPAPAAVA